jgi:hypothetical protein
LAILLHVGRLPSYEQHIQINDVIFPFDMEMRVNIHFSHLTCFEFAIAMQQAEFSMAFWILPVKEKSVIQIIKGSAKTIMYIHIERDARETTSHIPGRRG